MKALALKGLFLLCALSGAVVHAAAINYAGTWHLKAVGDDGTTVGQTVSVTQQVKNGVVYLSGGGYTLRLSGHTIGLSRVDKDPDATRSYSGRLSLSGRAGSGSATVREVYRNGQVMLTHYRLSASR